MWIVKIALSRPYTFIVLALLILILSPVVILENTDRHLSQHQYPGDRRGLDIHRPEARRRRKGVSPQSMNAS